MTSGPLISSGGRGALLAGWVIAICLNAQCAQIVFLGKSQERSTLQKKVAIAAEFYGLSTTSYQLGSEKDALRAFKAVREQNPLAVVLSAGALEIINRDKLLFSVRRGAHESIPLMVGGITAQTDRSVLSSWSSGAILGCRASAIAGKQSVYIVKESKTIARQLSSQRLNVRHSPSCDLMTDGRPETETLMTVSTGLSEPPVFVRVKLGEQELFFSADSGPDSLLPSATEYDQSESEFSLLAPVMMFVRYSGGEHAWHTSGHYANLTVDDAWLREPYGHLQYSALLREMQRHNFHTTIAFIPWNFDRSQAKVVSLVRAHGDRFSICVHGNNHDHQEFGSFETKPLELQTANIKQALARMEQFQTLTQIPYDRVMVFPHSIAPSGTLGALKQYNFLATVNSRDIPLGSSSPSDPGFSLRPITLSFSNFPSFRRYSAEVPVSRSEIAVDAFLGNPILFYVHQGYFADGIDRFDPVADMVNELQPDALWRGLGYISEHLYLERERQDGNYDIKAFSSKLQLENLHKKRAVFLVQKEEDFRFPLSLFVDGQSFEYTRDKDSIHFEIPIETGGSREITIEYQNDLNPKVIDVSKSSFRVTRLRRLSDFRDLILSQSAAGRKLTVVYTRLEETGKIYVFWSTVMVPCCIVIIACLLWKWKSVANRRKRLKARSAIG
jgi:hypothetical protein